MPEKNKTYRARIEGYTSESLGVARIDGQAVFVHRALRGEDCDVLIPVSYTHLRAHET